MRPLSWTPIKQTRTQHAHVPRHPCDSLSCHLRCSASSNPHSYCPLMYVLNRALPMRWNRWDRKQKFSITRTQVSPITNSMLHPYSTLQKKHLAHFSLKHNKFGYSGAPLSPPPQNTFDIQILEADTSESGAVIFWISTAAAMPSKKKKTKIKYFIYSLRKATELIAGITGQ